MESKMKGLNLDKMEFEDHTSNDIASGQKEAKEKDNHVNDTRKLDESQSPEDSSDDDDSVDISTDKEFMAVSIGDKNV